MRSLYATRRGLLAAFLFVAVTVTAGAPLFAQTASTAPVVWPVTIAPAGGKIVLYEPQVRSWPNYAQITGVAALAVTLPGGSVPVYGTLSFTSLASADVPSGTVSLVNSKLDATTWPTANQTDAASLDAFVKANLHVAGKPLLPLAMVLASIPRSARPHTVPVRTNPPVIYVSHRSALLIVFDGKPAFAPIPGTPLTYAVNTNWEIVHDPASSLYYVHAKSGWYSAARFAGPFTPAVAPASFAAAPKPAGAVVPRIIVSRVPSVLIHIAGSPQFASIAGTQLRYVTNTASDVFFSRDTTLWYVLIAGRWFSAANLNGPWAFASRHLPADFKKIPENGPRGRVLVSVPGTTQAFYAASAAQVAHVTPGNPTTAKLRVAYGSGAPIFAPIAGTPLQYAVNTADDVIKVNVSQYFACHEGVWFTASSPAGPWTPAAYVPAVIYTIQPSSPLFRVTFVHVYDARGVALTEPSATPAPQPQATYQSFAASQFSSGDAASYYNTNTIGYLGGYAPDWGGYAYGTGYYDPGWVGISGYIFNPPTYGNYNDTTYARRQSNSLPYPAMVMPVIPGHGPRSVPDPNANVYAADDGVYRSVPDGWQKNAGGENWTPATASGALIRDRRARLDGYQGTVTD